MSTTGCRGCWMNWLGGCVMSLDKFEKQLRRQVKEQFGERWPLVAYVVYARVTDPESMSMDESVWVVPEGQREFVTRGLLGAAKAEHEAVNQPVFALSDLEDWDDDE